MVGRDRGRVQPWSSRPRTEVSVRTPLGTPEKCTHVCCTRDAPWQWLLTLVSWVTPSASPASDSQRCRISGDIILPIYGRFAFLQKQKGTSRCEQRGALLQLCWESHAVFSEVWYPAPGGLDLPGLGGLPGHFKDSVVLLTLGWRKIELAHQNHRLTDVLTLNDVSSFKSNSRLF